MLLNKFYLKIGHTSSVNFQLYNIHKQRYVYKVSRLELIPTKVLKMFLLKQVTVEQ